MEDSAAPVKPTAMAESDKSTANGVGGDVTANRSPTNTQKV